MELLLGYQDNTLKFYLVSRVRCCKHQVKCRAPLTLLQISYALACRHLKHWNVQVWPTKALRVHAMNVHTSAWNHRQEPQQLPAVRLARHKENKPKQNPLPRPTKNPQKATKLKPNILYQQPAWKQQEQAASQGLMTPKEMVTEREKLRQKFPSPTAPEQEEQTESDSSNQGQPTAQVVTNSRDMPGQCTTEAEGRYPLPERLLRALVTCWWPWHKHLPWSIDLWCLVPNWGVKLCEKDTGECLLWHRKHGKSRGK